MMAIDPGGPQPIETLYKGCRFRSRLEARWAVFFDSLGIEWEYEKQGYVLSGKTYLPDFWLPYEPMKDEGWGQWVEIKGRPLTPEETFLLGELARETGHRTYAFCGNPWPGEYTVSVFMHHHHSVPDSVPQVTDAQIIEVDEHKRPELLSLFHEWGYHPGPSPRLRLVNPAGQIYHFVEGATFWAGWTGSLTEAFEAARSARFEHGESPKITRARSWARREPGWLLPPELRRGPEANDVE